MKEQNPDIPFVVRMHDSGGCVFFPSKEMIDKLILDPRGVLLHNCGVYYYIPVKAVCNAARVLRDTVQRCGSKRMKLQIKFNRYGEDPIDSELGKAIEAMAEEIKTLQKKHEESYPEATSSG